MLFHLYNPVPEDLRQASLGMKIALFREGLAIDNIDAVGQSIVDSNQQVVRYSAAFATDQLKPGKYRIRALLPNPESRAYPRLEQAFTIVD